MKKKLISIIFFIILTTTVLSTSEATNNYNVNIFINTNDSNVEDNYQKHTDYGPDQSQTIQNSHHYLSRYYEYAQSFKPTQDPLTSVELYLRHSDATKAITVSIRRDLNGETLTSVSISATGIPKNVWKWVEFDFPDIYVTPYNTYYIICTHISSGDLDVVAWGCCNYDVYPAGEAWAHPFGSSWYSIDEDFCFKTYSEPDLVISTIEPVQVVYDAPLVENKATVFRVKASSTFTGPVETHFRLVLPDSDWNKHPPRTGRKSTAVPPDYEYPEIWGPVILNPGVNELILPFIQVGMEERRWSSTSNPAGLINGVCIGGICGPDVRVVPSPKRNIATGTVIIDPNNEVSEGDEGNNVVGFSYTGIRSTQKVRIYFVLQIKNPSENNLLNCRILNCTLSPSCCPTPTCDLGGRTVNDVCNEIRELAKASVEYLLGVLPIADSKIEYTVDCDVKYRDDYSDFMGSMIELAKENDYDYVLAMQPWGYCGCCGVGSDGCYIELYGQPMNAAHELAGHGIQSIGYDCYACSPNNCPDCVDVACSSCGASEGFWVNKWISYPMGMYGTRPPTYYMDAVGSNQDRWQRLDKPFRFSDGGRLDGGYLQLLDIFSSSRDPQTAIISGIIYKSGVGELKPIKILGESDNIDLESGDTGDYYIVFIDSQNKVLDKFGFSVSFNMMTPEEGVVEMEYIHFVHRVEWNEETSRIELRDKYENVLALKEVSAHDPELNVIYPNGGEVWERGKNYTILWQGDDEDEDLLTYSIAISDDDGNTWLPVDIDIVDNEYELNTAALEDGENYIICVRGTDGVNTGIDVSDGKFTILPDMTPPSVSIEKPGNAFYYMDDKIIPFFFPVVVGDITIEVKADDIFGVSNVSFFVNDQLVYIDDTPPFDWFWCDNEQWFGIYSINVIACDYSGNSASYEVTVWKFL